MALPIAATPTYELTVPSTKEVVKYRPFLVKEEKALLIAQQSENPQTMFDTLKNIIEACTFKKLDVNKLATFDIEYIFIQLRAKSVGEISDLTFTCLECNDPKAKMKVSIELDKLEVRFDPEHSLDVPLYGDVGVKMKYPGIQTINKMKNFRPDDIQAIFDLIVACVDCIYDADNVYSANDTSKEDLIEFINNLTQEQFAKIQKFFETMPKLEKSIEIKCPVCGFDHKQTLSGIEGFF